MWCNLALLCVVQSEVASTVVCCAVWHCCVWCSLRLPGTAVCGAVRLPALLCVVQSEVAGIAVCGAVRLPALLCVVQSEVAGTVVCGAV